MSIDPKTWEILARGTAEILGEEELKAKLAKGAPLNIKLGVDPTTPDIHLGHTVVMRKLRQFQDLGHRVILIVGDYTATVGDPSGRNKTRPPLRHEQVLENAETYKQQFFKIVDPARTVVRYNGEWFGKMTFLEVIRLLGQITVAQMLEREDFKNRYEGGQPISLHEFLYPMMQGHDSVEIDADVELGGTDQKFNVLRGRELQRALGKDPQAGMFLPILLGTDGREKMSKSLGNYIGIDEAPRAMYHKLIMLPDTLIEDYFKLLTDKPLPELQAQLQEIAAGRASWQALKDELARNIVAQYHGEESAAAAALEEKSLKESPIGSAPSDAKVFELPEGPHTLPWLLRECGLAPSASAGTNFVTSGSAYFDGRKVTDPKEKFLVGESHILQVGKWKIVRIKRGNDGIGA